MVETIGDALGKPGKLIKTTVPDDDGNIQHLYEPSSDAIIYGDTDSVAGDSIVRSSMGSMAIEELFQLGRHTVVAGKEYAVIPGLMSPCYVNGSVVDKPVAAIYRHRVTKPRYRITLESGKSVVVTGDHSIMVLRAGELVEAKASDLNTETDTCISIGVH